MNQRNDTLISVLISFNVILSVICAPLIIDHISPKIFISLYISLCMISILHLGWVCLTRIDERYIDPVKTGYTYAIVCGFFFMILPYPMSILIFFLSFGMLSSVQYISKKHIKKQKHTLNQKIAYDLGLGDIEHKKAKLPFKFIGGFMTPLIPTQIIENVNRIKKGGISKHEIIIHELMHIKIMKMLFIPFVIVIGFISFGLFSLEINHFWVYLLMILIVSFCLTMNEKITFSATREYAIKKGMKPTRKFNWDHFKTYMIIYMIQITILIVFFEGMRLLLSKIII